MSMVERLYMSTYLTRIARIDARDTGIAGFFLGCVYIYVCGCV